MRYGQPGPFIFDLTAHEVTRLAAILDAAGPHWDPIEVYTGETQAQRLLYANLDADQQAGYHVLLAAKVLPDTREVVT